MANQWDPSGVFEVLASEESRRILAAASVQPVSANELEQICNSSLPTIYRRLNVLVEHGFLSEQTIDPDQNQSKQYTTDLEEINIGIADGEIQISIEVKKDAVDKFGELFRDLGEESHRQRSSTQSEFAFDSVPEE